MPREGWNVFHWNGSRTSQETDARSGREDQVGSRGIATSRPGQQAPHLQHRISNLRFNGCVLSWRKCRLPRHRSAYHRVPLCQPMCHRGNSFRSTGPRQMDGGQTHGTPGCDRIRRSGVDPRCHGFDRHRCGTAQEVPSIVSNMVT